MTGQPRAIGVIGTMVWDTIWRDDDVGSPIEEWGGISYALAAADALVNHEAAVRPFIKLGRDLAEQGLRYLRQLRAVDTDTAAIQIVDRPNPRVELRYTGSTRRSERLRGGVPAWTWPELAAQLESCDALYINFITGNELDLECAQQIRASFTGPIYADIHSLLLATGPRGERYPQPLARWSEWLSCFDAVQMNQDELRSLSAHWGDPWKFAASVVGRETPLLLVTLGEGGAAYVMTPDALPLGDTRRSGLERRTRVRAGRIVPAAVREGDPTGCGDVWGFTMFHALASGRGVEEAIRIANALAGRNVRHRGTSGLNRYLRGEFERA